VADQYTITVMCGCCGGTGGGGACCLCDPDKSVCLAIAGSGFSDVGVPFAPGFYELVSGALVSSWVPPSEDIVGEPYSCALLFSLGFCGTTTVVVDGITYPLCYHVTFVFALVCTSGGIQLYGAFATDNGDGTFTIADVSGFAYPGTEPLQDGWTLLGTAAAGGCAADGSYTSPFTVDLLTTPEPFGGLAYGYPTVTIPSFTLAFGYDTGTGLCPSGGSTTDTGSGAGYIYQSADEWPSPRAHDSCTFPGADCGLPFGGYPVVTGPPPSGSSTPHPPIASECCIDGLEPGAIPVAFSGSGTCSCANGSTAGLVYVKNMTLPGGATGDGWMINTLLCGQFLRVVLLCPTGGGPVVTYGDWAGAVMTVTLIGFPCGRPAPGTNLATFVASVAGGQPCDGTVAITAA
jgi:hypothetical protein